MGLRASDHPLEFCHPPHPLEQAAQRNGLCPTPGNTQGQAGGAFKQPAVAEDVPACDRWS